MKPRKIILLALSILYGFLSLFLFSESLIVQLIEIEKEYYINESRNFEQLTFTKEQWLQYEGQSEFQIQGKYYDVKGVRTTDEKVTVTVVMDEYENLLKYIAKNIGPKGKKGKNSKNSKNSKLKLLFDVCLDKTPISSGVCQLKVKEHKFFYVLPSFKLEQHSIFRPPRAV